MVRLRDRTGPSRNSGAEDEGSPGGKIALLAELEAQPEVEKIVGLHPAALQHFEKLVGQLGEVFGRGVTPDNEEAAEKIRELVAKVVVKPSDHGFKIEIQGRLTLLMGAPNVYPNMRIAASGERW